MTEVYTAAELASCTVAGTLPPKSYTLRAGARGFIILNDSPYTFNVDIPFSAVECVPAFSRVSIPVQMQINGAAEFKHVSTTPTTAYVAGGLRCAVEATGTPQRPDVIPLGALPVYKVTGNINP